LQRRYFIFCSHQQTILQRKWVFIKNNQNPKSLYSDFNLDYASSLQLNRTFHRSLVLRITTLLTWLKSTLLPKIKCFNTTIYMKTQCLQTNETQHYCRKERCLRSGVRKRKRVTRDRKRRSWGVVAKSSWKCQLIN